VLGWVCECHVPRPLLPVLRGNIIFFLALLALG
jgi:hypothetical protein